MPADGAECPMRLSQLPSVALHPRRFRPGGIGNWSGHLPFAYDLVFAVKPALFVELGTHYGESYFGFCQAVEDSKHPCLCYAVDTWRGDVHAGLYGEEVFRDVEAYNVNTYSPFSTLLRMTFAEALAHFTDNSIDILHIDGLHTYDAVKQDFYNWFPKVRENGMVLIHDVAVRRDDFGVWRFWEELSEQFDTFTFTHGNGLGVLQKGREIRRAPGRAETKHHHKAEKVNLVSLLLDGFSEDREWLRSYYAGCAERLDLRYYAQTVARGGFDRRSFVAFAVYFPKDNSYGEDRCFTARIPPGVRRKVAFDLPCGFGKGRLRIDPADCPSLITIESIEVLSANDRRMIWSATNEGALRALDSSGSACRLPGNRCYEILSFGIDPQLYLPELPEPARDQPLELEVDIRVETDPAEWLPRIAALIDSDHEAFELVRTKMGGRVR